MTAALPCHEGNQAIEVESSGVFFIEVSCRLVVEFDSRLPHNFEAVLFDDFQNMLQGHRIFDCVRLNHRESQHRETLKCKRPKLCLQKSFDTESTSKSKRRAAIKTKSINI